MTALSMGSMCNLLSLLGGSAAPTPTIASTFPTRTPTPISTAVGTATPSGSPTATPVATATPSVAFLVSASPATQNKGFAINFNGGNLGVTGNTSLSLTGNFVTSPLLVAAANLTVTGNGTTINMLVPDLGVIGNLPVTVTANCTLDGFGFATLINAFTYNP